MMMVLEMLGAPYNARAAAGLLDFQVGTRRLELLELVGLCLGQSFLDRLGCVVHHRFGVMKAMAGDGARFPEGLVVRFLGRHE